MPPFTPHHLCQVRDLAQLLTHCSTQENGFSVSLGQYNRVDPEDKGMGEPALSV